MSLRIQFDSWTPATGMLLARIQRFAAILLLGGAAIAAALEPSTPLANYSRQSWAMENGLPQNTVQALAQTRDGFLWLGTEAGLVRFDGVEFQTFDKNSNPTLPGNDIRCLIGARDGSLWIGTNAGLVHWKDGVARTFTARDGLPADGILTVSENDEGNIFAWTEQGPAQLSSDRFESVRNVDAFPHTATPSPGEYSGAVAFEAELSSGILVMGDRSTLNLLQGREHPRTLSELRVGRELPGGRIQAMLADRGGALWIGTNGGLVRWMKGKVERFPVTDSLADASILALMEDREGNLWVGTETEGVHILRDQRFHTLDSRMGLSSDRITTVVEDSAGSLWAGTQGDGLNQLRRDASTAGWRIQRTYTVNNGLASNVILSLAAGLGGDLWVGTPDGLNHIRGSRVETFTSADGLPDDFIRSLLIDGDGSLWIGTRRGLTHWAIGKGTPFRPDATMKTYTKASGLGSDLVGAMARGARGDLWVATLAGLSRLQGDAIANYTTANGLPSNVITALLPRADGSLLVGTQDHGWDVWDGNRFSPAVPGGLEQTTIYAILDDGSGHLWFATGNGIARCDCSAARGGAMPEDSHWMDFGTADGLHSRETATNSHPSAWRSRDGRLWFATPKGLVEADPAHFPVNALPPPVELERVLVDDLTQQLSGPNARLVVKAGHVHFEFDYAALSFVAPQKVRYRYMLEGFDRGWTDAGSRRAAYYTNIPPGHYTFRVQASNNDGVWNTTGAALPFVLRPHFYQTLWFYLLLLAIGVCCVVLFLRQRLRRAQREFQVVLGERSRIAREIHDTLAQGYVGVSVQLEVLSQLLRQQKVDAAEKQLDQAREFVRHGLADARQSIWALRTQDDDETTLPVKLRRMAEAEGNESLKAEFRLFGAYRPLPPATEREVIRVAQEAIHNVKKHAEAGRLSVELAYHADQISLEVRDDGRGGAQESTEGHFGITGMRERAAAIGATLDVTSAPGEGTTIRLCVPARRDSREQSGGQE